MSLMSLCDHFDSNVNIIKELNDKCQDLTTENNQLGKMVVELNTEKDRLGKMVVELTMQLINTQRTLLTFTGEELDKY
jgi:hypothetical protein